jgi:hypothetical protein
LQGTIMHTASEFLVPRRTPAAPLHHPAARYRDERDRGETIIGVPFETPNDLRSMLLDPEAANDLPDCAKNLRLFKIRAADNHGHRSAASILINKMYASRGYTTSGLPIQDPHRITLMACEHDETVGTITVGFDSALGLNVDDLFQKEIDDLRDSGRRVCEFTKLAMDHVVKSKRVLASLFHVAYIYAHRLKGYDDLLIEVNPRHVRYYERMLGFVVKGPERLNKRVNAPAVLMALDFTHAQDQIGIFGGKPHLGSAERSLYPHFFSVGEEAGIVGRLLS